MESAPAASLFISLSLSLNPAQLQPNKFPVGVAAAATSTE